VLGATIFCMPTRESVPPLPPAWPQQVKRGVLEVLGIAHLAVTTTRSWCENSRLIRVRLASRVERLEAEVALLQEEMRIKDARVAKLEPARRPHYGPRERMAILELRAARGWSLALAAERFLVTAVTLASWSKRLDEDPTSLLAVASPVNRFSEMVELVVQRLRVLVPTMGKVRIAQTLARAGLHLGASTVKRMLERKKAAPTPPTPKTPRASSGRVVTAKRAHHVWNVDLTEVPTSGGRWAPWFPFCLSPRHPHVWWVAAIIDHFSRRVIGFAVFESVPTAKQVCDVLERARKRAGRAPAHLISDRGVHFRAQYEAWCARHHVRPRFGAVGQHGSIAVIERFWLTLKTELLGRMLVPLRLDTMRDVMRRYVDWYNAERPHRSLGGATPLEVCEGVRPANERARLEPRARYPATSPCAAPTTKVRGRCGAKLRLVVGGFDGGDVKITPHVEIRRAA
jgi:putative transposase